MCATRSCCDVLQRKQRFDMCPHSCITPADLILKPLIIVGGFMKFFAFLFLSFPLMVQANSLGNDVIGNLEIMKSVYSAEYAPSAWKKLYAGYDLDTEFTKAVTDVQSRPDLTQKEARTILKNFIYAMKDYHTSISFLSTEAATLPLTIKGTDDRFFIVEIDRTKLSTAAFPFNVGDEVITFDGVAVLDAVTKVQTEITGNVSGTDKAIAEMNLTRRRASRGLEVPNGPITLGIKAKDTNDVREVQLIWDYTPEKIAPRKLQTANTSSKLFSPQMNVDIVDADFDSPYTLGGRTTFTPDLGAKIWESNPDNTFYAYIYKATDGKLIGYLRLPSYSIADGNYDKAVGDFAQIITRFEAVTDKMIIDQVNNPGGSVFYLYALASMLSTQPLKTPLHRMAITQADVNEALSGIAQLENVKSDEEAQKIIGATAAGYPVTYEFVQFYLSYARFFVSEWTAGRKLTNPYWISGVSHINPAATHYTKPILILTNHLDFSGGDFFPAILQDNKRVTILGSNTAGAGGYVNDVEVPNNVGISSFRCTMSIAERVSGNPIENLGVTPDISYEMTVDDFTQNYAPYVKAIEKAVLGL